MKTTEVNYTPIQLKSQVDMERIIEIFDRIIRMNYELTSFHKEVLDNLNSIHGALLRINRSIQSEGTYGEIKANRGYERFRRRGINKVILEIALISCGFNLHKYHLSKLAKANPVKAAG